MMWTRMVVAALVAAMNISGAWGQSGAYPNKPMRWVIPFAPGGGTDVIARPIALKVGEVLGQQVIYDNRGGGGGLIAAEMVAKSAPDGYTFLVGAGNTHVMATLVNDKVPFDPVKDYAPITKFATIPNVLVATPSFAPKTLQELVAYGKANPGKINWSSSGNGTAGHLALVMFAQMAGIKVEHVPFKGAGLATNAVLAGDCDLLFANTGVFLPQIKAGKLRVLGVAGARRLTALPDAPLFTDNGFPGYESSSFYGLLAPAGTPAAIIKLQHDTIARIIHSPESIARMANDGAYPVGNTPEQFAEENRQQVQKWSKIIRENNIKAD